MGLGSWFKKNVVEPVKKHVVEPIKETARTIIKTVVEWATKTENVKKDFTENVQKENEYSNKNSTTVNNYASLISKYQNEMRSISNELEQQCIKLYFQHFETFIEGLEKEGDKSKVWSIVEEGEKKLHGTIKDYINKKVSIDNFEFKRIIEMPSNYNKTNEINDFQEQILIQARDLFCRKLEEICKKQNDDIQSYFSSQISDLKTKNNKIIEEFEQLQKITTQDESEKNNELIKRGVIIAGCDYILNKL